jgi:hypothetical protein
VQSESERAAVVGRPKGQMQIIASRIYGEHYDAYISSCSYCACGTQQLVPRFDRRLGFRPWVRGGLRPFELCGTPSFCGAPAVLCGTPAVFHGSKAVLCGPARYGSAVLFLVTL